ncbi:MAG TPA: DUF1553 domain-containing protein [Candidatus Binatia bacterium]|nr:DUF1553 domain-containing protein [Candidatus Binatia bacterium]
MDFVKDIQPVLERSCLKCHNAALSMSGLRLDNRAEALKGGDLGVDIFPGQSAKSRAIHFAGRLVPQLEMPPKGQGDSLTDEEVGLLRAWIDQGAEWPGGVVLRSRLKPNPELDPDKDTAQDSSTLPPPANRNVDFVKEIRPLLASKCYPCHGPNQQKNQLRWDVKAIAARGGISGPAFKPGKSAESLVIRLVGGLQPGLVMPLQGERLTSIEIGLLRAWIDQGARWPEGLDPKDYSAQPVHWAYRPLARPVAPKVKGSSWVRSPIDSFILARLQEKKLAPSAPADKRALLRRVTYDSTGLPPAPEEIQAFLADSAPDAYIKVVDRLLASPRYGERWARHWLDVVHYADSHGHDQDRPRDNAWPYRDYVIRAFNEDKPYARFVEEQLAGDVLFPDQPEATVATGFIGTGPFDESSMISIVDDTMDKKRAQSLDRDDMVMTAMSTFVSSTVHCARCHNHKFDPIPQKEYYRLQAVFAGVDRADRPYDLDPTTHVLRQSLLRERAALEEKRIKLDEIAARLDTPELRQLDERLHKLQQDLGREKQAPQSPSNSLGYQSQVSSPYVKSKWVQVDFGKSLPLDQVYLVPVQHAEVSGFGFPTRFRVDLSNDPLFGSCHTLADHSTTALPNPGAAPFAIQNAGHSGRYLRVTAFDSADKESSYWFFALAEVLAFSGEKNVAAGSKVTSLDSVENRPQWGRANLVDGYSSTLKLMSVDGDPVPSADIMNALQASSRRWELELSLKHAEAERRDLAASLIEPALRSELDKKLAEINRRLADLPPSQMVYAGASDFATTGNFHPSKGVARPVHILKRGEITAPGEPVSPGALSMIPGLEAGFHLEDPDREGSRRAALARWITSSRNALTWRSIVNRVWHYHFGRGLVNTPNDFGRMGGVPSHPELLDWLAAWFLDNGGSFKKLHRLILTSSVYLQSSQGNPAYANLDAENQFLWRMNRRQLDAEAVRDSVLQVTGKLDLTMGGPPVKQFFYEDPNPGVTPIIDYGRFDVDSPDSFRRSIYRYVFRTVTDPFMDSLDCPDASQLAPVRNTSVTALQALTLWNDRLIVRQAEHFAERLGKIGPDLGAQIEAACELAWGRPPSRTEAKALLGYASRHGMANTCRVLFNGNEFIFVN